MTVQQGESAGHCLGYSAVIMWHLEAGALHIAEK